MHDNTWTRALIDAGCEATLLPTYTPIRLDEPDRSDKHLFLGGINIYLDQRWSVWRRIPRRLTRWLDSPTLINFAARLSTRYDARRLGELTLAMLSGEHGPQRREIDELARYIARELRPDCVIFSNALLVGVLHRLRQKFDGPVFCTLQGDDVFLDYLPDSHRDRAMAMVSEKSREFDAFLVHTQFYRDYMERYLQLPADKFRQLPLSIDLTGHDGRPGERAGEPFTVGYFARIARPKGLHRLVEAFRLLHARRPEVRLRVGGYHAEKVEFFKSTDVLSVPTEFQEPKGLYVLEALANGVPVVQPRHGSFPELIAATGGGRLVTPGDPQELADVLQELADDADQRYSLGATGQINVRENFAPAALAEATLRLLK
jgi:glycosyltransferase involved in cell wall biosynthesis